MKQLHLTEIIPARQPSPEDHYNQLWSELSELQEPARKNTKAHRTWQQKKEQLLAGLMNMESEMENGRP